MSDTDRLELAAHKIGLKRHYILLLYSPPATHPEEVPRNIWQTIDTQMQRAVVTKFSIGGRKPRIVLISPLPPACSCVADYSRALPKALQTTTELPLFTPEPTEGTKTLLHLPHITRRFDRVISVMGNSLPHHGKIYNIIIPFKNVPLLARPWIFLRRFSVV